jgi:hypothetical protein
MGPLEAVHSTATKAREWTAKRDAAISDARAAGHSLRAIADAAGLSHTAVAKIASRVAVRSPTPPPTTEGP